MLQIVDLIQLERKAFAGILIVELNASTVKSANMLRDVAIVMRHLMGSIHVIK